MDKMPDKNNTPLDDGTLDQVSGGAGNALPAAPPPYTMDSANDPDATPIDNAYKYGSAGNRFNLGGN